MDRKEWNKIEGIIDQVLDAPLTERKELLEELCKNDQSLKDRVLHMLDSMDNSDPFFDQISESKNNLFSNVEHEIAEETDENIIGKTIDNYKIIRKIGTGGMGTVFLASRCDGVFDKKAAIKLLRREFAVPAIKIQFKLERQILANLKHPGIARLYDGGIYKGLPYLVMEYVEGLPIDEYCNEKRLNVDQRIILFKSVLEIVKYAHNNLVIHRDLKPENILITEKGEVKILDFGISQIEKETPDSEGQNPQKHFLTPVYASPEQMGDGNIGTSSDIYSLGILLQKLLTDQLPFDIKNKDINEIKTIKLSESPNSASKTLKNLPGRKQKKIAHKRSSKPKYLTRKLKNDLDQIILKSLELDQNKRYATVGQFLEDLKHYEKQLPVSACSNSLPYRTSKFMSRNKYLLSLAASLLVVILLALFITINRVNVEHQLAVAEANKAEEMTGYLIELFEAADPTNTQQNDINVRELLYHGIDRTEEISDPEIRASMLTVMGDALTKISDFETADIVLNKAVEENKNAFGDNSVSTADALFAFGLKHSKDSMWHLALPYFQESYEIYSNRLDQNNHKVITSLSKLGLAMLNEGEVDSAKVYIETAYNRMQDTRDANSPELLDTMVDYAYYLGSTNSHEESIEMLNSVLDSYLEIGLENHFRLIKPYHYTAINYRHLGQYEKAVENYKKALTISKNTIGEDHLTTRRIRSNLINPLSRLGEHDSVVYHYKRNIELMENRFSYNHWRTGQALGAYGGYQKSLGNYQEALTLYEKNLEIYQEAIGPDHIWTAYVEGALAAINRFLNNHSEADRLFERHIEIYSERYPDYNNDHIGQIRRLIRMYENAEGDYDDIIELYGKLLE